MNYIALGGFNHLDGRLEDKASDFHRSYRFWTGFTNQSVKLQEIDFIFTRKVYVGDL